jgi:alpha-tubulin suppressor-like RCC1 family protein
MALNFPDNPTPGQQYTDPNNLIWEFNGVVWTPITGTVGTSGFSGFSGYSGYSGTSGYSGINGISGFSGSGSAIAASDEGNLLTNTVSSFNFVGTNVVATNVGGAVTVTIEPPIVYNNSIWSWGCGGNGRLGDNTTVDKSSPVSVIGGFTDWCQLALGEKHGAALRTNGTIWAWGYNNCGQLGDNSTVAKSSPVSVVGGFTDWCQVSAGTAHSLGVRTNGTAWAWGRQSLGALGDNSSVNKSSPVSVVGGFTDWCQVSGGGSFSIALRQNGTAWAWGYGLPLGNNCTANQSSPVSVAGGFTDWCQVAAAAGNFSLAIRTNGTAWAWGINGYGRLGDNTTVNKSSPVSVVGGFTDWCQVSAGAGHSLGVRTNGTAWAWGRAEFGTLGDNTTVSKSSPVSVVGGFTNWCQVSSGSRNSFGLRTNGTAWSWGWGLLGALGDNTTVDKSSPVSIAGGFTDWVCLSYPNSADALWSGAIRSTAT